MIVDSMGGAPWDSYALEDMRVVALGEEAAVVAYGATAARGDTEVSSLFNSTYVRVDGSLAPGAAPADPAMRPVGRSVRRANDRPRPVDRDHG